MGAVVVVVMVAMAMVKTTTTTTCIFHALCGEVSAQLLLSLPCPTDERSYTHDF
jgi:hypothetical protein